MGLWIYPVHWHFRNPEGEAFSGVIWHAKFRQVVMYTDSTAVLSLLKDRDYRFHVYAPINSSIRAFLDRIGALS